MRTPQGIPRTAVHSRPATAARSSAPRIPASAPKAEAEYDMESRRDEHRSPLSPGKGLGDRR